MFYSIVLIPLSFAALVVARTEPHASAFAGSTSAAVFPPPGATIIESDTFFPDATEVGFAGPTPSQCMVFIFLLSVSHIFVSDQPETKLKPSRRPVHSPNTLIHTHWLNLSFWNPTERALSRVHSTLSVTGEICPLGSPLILVTSGYRTRLLKSPEAVTFFRFTFFTGMAPDILLPALDLVRFLRRSMQRRTAPGFLPAVHWSSWTLGPINWVLNYWHPSDASSCERIEYIFVHEWALNVYLHAGLILVSVSAWNMATFSRVSLIYLSSALHLKVRSAADALGICITYLRAAFVARMVDSAYAPSCRLLDGSHLIHWLLAYTLPQGSLECNSIPLHTISLLQSKPGM